METKEIRNVLFYEYTVKLNDNQRVDIMEREKEIYATDNYIIYLHDFFKTEDFLAGKCRFTFPHAFSLVRISSIFF